MITTSVLEYITSWGMEKTFHAKWWDYSTYKFNINGRICLKNSVLFGVMSLVLMYLLHPFLQGLIQNISQFLLGIIATAAAVLFTADVVESTRETLDFNKKLGTIYEATTEFKNVLKEKGINTAHDLKVKVKDLKIETLSGANEKLSDAKDSAYSVIANLTSRILVNKRFNRYTHRRILNAFPHMAHRKHPDSLEVYKVLLEEDKK